MNKILKLSAIALLSMSTSLMAQKSFQGTSVALTASVVGAEAKGTVTSSDLNSNSDSGSVGRIGAFAGVDAAYTVGAGTNGFFGFGASYIPFKAEIATASGGGRMKGGDFAGGNLAEGVHAPIGSAGSCNGHGSIKDFLKGFLEGELDGGIGILSLPTEEVLAPIGKKETVRDRLHPGINGGRLRARDYRSSR